MRISQDRYNRDRLRYDLAVRMMGHGARACTISSWTGLTADRQRKLFRSYFMYWSTGAGARRRRGKSPRQPVFFLQTSELSFEASMLGAMFHLQGLLREKGAGLDAGTSTSPIVSPEQATLFCAIYEDHTQRYPAARISFEYAWFLLKCLLDGQLCLAVCKKCRRLYVRDSQCLQEVHCGCAGSLPKFHRRPRLPRPLQHAISIAKTDP